jgi:release factor glutamine methyltransferase
MPLPLDAVTTRSMARRALTNRFRVAGLEDPEKEAMLVIAAAGVSRLGLIAEPDTPLGDAAGKIEALARRREAGEPLTRIIGRREFWSLDFRVTPDVLDPRPDTETIIEAALAAFAGRQSEPLRIVDFGVGSGAILAALLTEFPDAIGLGVDRSEAAARVARENFDALGFSRAEVRVGDWGAGLTGPFDLIVSNPPYIPSAEIATLAREVRDHDPRLALDGGVDGLDAYRALAPEIARLLAADGRFALEFGQGQGDEVERILAGAGLGVSFRRADLSGIERVIVGGRGTG